MVSNLQLKAQNETHAEVAPCSLQSVTSSRSFEQNEAT